MKNKKKIVVTGGSGRFGSCLRKKSTKYNIIFPSKLELDITKYSKLLKYLKKTKPHYLIHLAGLTRPMSQHESLISKSISLNIIGTANIVKVCSTLKIKLIYFSTNYVYPGTKGNYSENDPVLPINNYAISKLGGECAVQMYKNSLILRISMTEKPFIHKEAFNDVEMNFMYHEQLATNLLKLINHKGIINVGGMKKTVFDFAKKDNPNVKPVTSKKILGKQFPRKQTMNLKKYHKIIKK